MVYRESWQIGSIHYICIKMIQIDSSLINCF
jgi:hypothetical protein